VARFGKRFIKILIDNGANINVKDCYGKTVLQLVEKKPDSKFAEYFNDNWEELKKRLPKD